MTDKCLVRLEKLLKKSSITSAKKDEIINSIKLAKAEKGLSKVDEVNIDAIAKDVSAQIKAQKIIDKRNALESEIKVRQLTEFVLKSFPDNAEEGLTAILVGSNRRVEGARSAVSVQQFAQANQLIAGFNAELRANNLETMFKDGLEGLSEAQTQRRVTNAMSELAQQQTEIEKLTGLKPPVTETNPKILKLAEIMEKYSEMIRQKLNDRGANIEKMWGYIVKQSHDPFRVRNAADSLGLKLADIKLDEGIKGTDINYQKNYTAWKNYVMQKLDENRTFANTDDRENFLQEIFRF